MSFCNVCIKDLPNIPFFIVKEEDLVSEIPSFTFGKHTTLHELLVALTKYMTSRPKQVVHFQRPGAHPMYFCDFCIHCCSTEISLRKSTVPTRKDLSTRSEIITTHPRSLRPMGIDSSMSRESVTMSPLSLPPKEIQFSPIPEGSSLVSDPKDEDDDECYSVYSLDLGSEGDDTLFLESNVLSPDSKGKEESAPVSDSKKESAILEPKLQDGCVSNSEGKEAVSVVPGPKKEDVKVHKYRPQKGVPPVGSFNRHNWQTHLKLNGDESNMYSQFMKFTDFFKSLNKILDPTCYQSAVLSRSKVREIIEEYPFHPHQNFEYYAQSIVKYSEKRAIAHAKGTLIKEDLMYAFLTMENVYCKHLYQKFGNMYMNLDALYLMGELAMLYFSYFSFPAWRVAFYILWKHIENEAQKKKVVKVMLRRVPVNSYTRVIYKFIAKEVNILSLYNHEQMCAKSVHFRKMEIYKYNYETIERMVGKGEIPAVQKLKNKRKFFRRPENYSPSFDDVCKQVEPRWTNIKIVPNNM